jgi:hypothetical protein
MAEIDDVSMIRITDSAGAQAVIACVPSRAKEFMSIGEPESWTENCKPVTSVIVDVSGAVQLTDADDVSALAAWLSAASVWLKTKQLTEEE